MKRFANNPLISPRKLPDRPPHLSDVSSIFNPGVVRFGEEILMLARVQNRGRRTFIMPMRSRDGYRFEMGEEPVVFEGLDLEGVFHVYDPRITPLEDRFVVTVSVDTDRGCRVGVAETESFERFLFLGYLDDEDCRNGAVFPEKINGRYWMTARPNRVASEGGPTSGDSIFLYSSEDLAAWREEQLLMQGRPHYWDERIGSGPPPLKTRKGWLHLYHGVATHFASCNIYQAGAVLLDLEQPGRVLARTEQNILEPRQTYELTGQVPNVVFPSGWVAEDVDAEGFLAENTRIMVYYGAADTHIGLAHTTLGRLLDACGV